MYYTIVLMLLVNIMLCSKLPCIRTLNFFGGNMPSRDTYLHMLGVIAKGARQVPTTVRDTYVHRL